MTVKERIRVHHFVPRPIRYYDQNHHDDNRKPVSSTQQLFSRLVLLKLAIVSSKIEVMDKYVENSLFLSRGFLN